MGIAARFNLRPETVLWGSYAALKEDAHRLRVGQTLTILPIDGLYHYVTEGSTLEQIARFYQVAPEAIVAWPGNELATAASPPRPNSSLLIPGGARQSQAWALPSLPRVDLNIPGHRRMFVVSVSVISLFLLLTGVGSYQAYEFTESTTFCGELCHVVMSPEHTAWKNSPHAKVKCVECHVGPGAKWYKRN